MNSKRGVFSREMGYNLDSCCLDLGQAFGLHFGPSVWPAHLSQNGIVLISGMWLSLGHACWAT